jgi:hypothetical protein
MSSTFQTSAPTSRVEEVVKRGWRRRLVVLAVDQSAVALALVFGGLALLIVLGTQIFAWQWILLLAAIGLGFSAYGVYHRLSDAYHVAQMMDRRLALHDALSTAWFLHTQPEADQPAATFLLDRAEQIAQHADPAKAFPFQRRRAWVVTACLFILASILFSARYLVTHELSLEHSFLPMAVTQVFENLGRGTKDELKDQDGSGHMDKTLPPGSLGEDARRRSQTPNAEQGKQPSQDQSKGGDASHNGEAGPNQDPQQAKNGDGKGSSDQKQNGGEGKPADGKPEASQQPPNGQEKNGDQQEGKQPDSNGPQKSSSLMDRMRDALSSVMAKMKPNGNSQQSQNNSQKNSDGQKNSDQNASKDQSGDGQKDTGKDQSAQEQSTGQQSQQGTAKSQASQGKDSAAPSDKKGSDAQSGVGHSDGDKAVREAEQAKAMGKLAEIIGKRSASLTGDMQIVPNGKQKLQTDYTHAQGQHSDLGGEINRDEVPVEDQEYVREYMELVRKKPSAAAKKGSAKSTTSENQ